MYRTLTIAFVIFLVSGLIGCRFCASPYDYCPPTFTGDEYDFPANPYDPLFTAGSRFYGTEDFCQCNGCDLGCDACDEGHYHESPMPTQEQTPTPAPELDTRTTIPVPTLDRGNVPSVGVPSKVTTSQYTPRQQSRSQSAAKSVPLPPPPAAPNPHYASEVSDQELQSLPFSKEELQRLNPDAVEITIIGIEDGE